MSALKVLITFNNECKLVK